METTGTPIAAAITAADIAAAGPYPVTVTNPAPASVYQSQRYGNFTYTIPNLLTNGDFELGLQGWGSWGQWDGGRDDHVAASGARSQHCLE